ncbi:MAG TPA: hypothetical protein VGE04_19765 [Chloroflexia bacterium]|jgi:hypothetical protein
MKRKSAVALVVIAIFFTAQILAPAVAAACSYLPYSPVRSFREADAAFIGTVVDAKEERQLDADGRSYQARTTYRFQVITSWKGVSTPEVTILFLEHVMLDEYGRRIELSMCPGPYGFTPGAMYVVFAVRDPETHALRSAVGLGARSRQLRSIADAQPEIRALGKGKQWIYTGGVGMPKAGAAELNVGAALAIPLVALGLGLALQIFSRRYRQG